MADDFYSDAPDGEPSPPPKPPEKGDDADKTFLAPKSAFGGKGVGSTCEVKVVAEHDDELELRYVPHGKSKEPESSGDMDELME